MKFFRRAIVDICICKSDFQNNYFLQRIALSEYLIALIFFCGTVELLRRYIRSIKLV